MQNPTDNFPFRRGMNLTFVCVLIAIAKTTTTALALKVMWAWFVHQLSPHLPATISFPLAVGIMAVAQLFQPQSFENGLFQSRSEREEETKKLIQNTTYRAFWLGLNSVIARPLATILIGRMFKELL